MSSLSTESKSEKRFPEEIAQVTNEKPRAFHIGRIEDNVTYLRMASILDRRINPIKIILNPPKSVPCFSASCFGPHALERAA